MSPITQLVDMTVAILACLEQAIKCLLPDGDSPLRRDIEGYVGCVSAASTRLKRASISMMKKPAFRHRLEEVAPAEPSPILPCYHLGALVREIRFRANSLQTDVDRLLRPDETAMRRAFGEFQDRLTVLDAQVRGYLYYDINDIPLDLSDHSRLHATMSDHIATGSNIYYGVNSEAQQQATSDLESISSRSLSPVDTGDCPLGPPPSPPSQDSSPPSNNTADPNMSA